MSKTYTIIGGIIVLILALAAMVWTGRIPLERLGIGTPPAPPEAAAVLPLAVQKANEDLAKRFSAAPEAVFIVDAKETQWPDGCLGLGKPDQVCTKEAILGYLVRMTYEKKEYRYRTDKDGAIVIPEN